MAHWLLKTEPGEFSADDLRRLKRSVWDGVANATALIHLRAMAVDDEIAIYHTGDIRAVVATARVARAAYPDPGLQDPRRVVVDIEFDALLRHPVTLAHIKSDPTFEGWDLLRIGRLSVVPTPAKMWNRLIQLSSTPGKR
jgi:predicted RNA-binding protein with PUA-like domain